MTNQEKVVMLSLQLSAARIYADSNPGEASGMFHVEMYADELDKAVLKFAEEIKENL